MFEDLTDSKAKNSQKVPASLVRQTLGNDATIILLTIMPSDRGYSLVQLDILNTERQKNFK
jgi:hypothetical protein